MKTVKMQRVSRHAVVPYFVSRDELGACVLTTTKGYYWLIVHGSVYTGC